jgi:basic amino acid/polyamine antiporter, APA family
MQGKKISIFAAAAIVIANMVGTGVFTSLGFQLSAVQNTYSIIILWVGGGLLSLFGAFAYAELGTHFKQSGGDYIYLSRVFHPLFGYLSSWICLSAGFSVPIALSAMALTKYLQAIGLQFNGNIVATAIICGIAILHSVSLKASSVFQISTTAVKVIFIIVLIAVGAFFSQQNFSALNFSNTWQHEVATPGFAVSMVFVYYAYVGWNAAAYVTGELQNPNKNLPKALILSTVFVTICYVLLQIVMLKNASLQSLQGKEEVTYIAYKNLMGSSFGKWVSIFIAVQLVATIGSYLWVASRVTQATATEFKLWQPLAKNNKQNIPVRAIWLTAIVACLLTLTNAFQSLNLYAGFVLQLMGTLTVATSLFIKTKQGNFKSPFKPFLQILFLVFSIAVLIFTAYDKPTETGIGLGILAIGVLLYFLDTKLTRNTPSPQE